MRQRLVPSARPTPVADTQPQPRPTLPTVARGHDADARRRRRSLAGTAAPSLPASGGTLRVSRLGDIPPRRAPHHRRGHHVDSVRSLTAYDEQLQPQPMLAESWDISPTTRRSS